VDEWGVGRYEETAEELAPAAAVAVGALGLAGGERVLDVACGTGNAALVAHRAGARVTGIDTSPRLVGVARERIPDGHFMEADATDLPFADGEFDDAVSVFGVIFARPADRAAAEMARVVHPGGRVVVTAWLPRGPVFAAVKLMRETLARVRPPAPAGPPPVEWGNPAVLEELLGPFGEVEVTEQELAYEHATPEQFIERWERSHPIFIGARRELEPTGEWDAFRAGSIAALRDGGMGRGATSPYLLAVLTRE
jgi:ubiquinone/menaquinone biosynthesis C-methylase UbiE